MASHGLNSDVALTWTLYSVSCQPATENPLLSTAYPRESSAVAVIETYTLPDFAEWLERKAQAIQVARRVTDAARLDATPTERDGKAARPRESNSASIYVTNQPENSYTPQSPDAYTKPGQSPKKQERFMPYCPYCSNQEHHLSACAEFA